MYKLIFYVPKADAQSVKKAIFATGAGSLGNYSECSFEVEGTGQFRPNSKANPAIGRSNKLEKVIELKVEILCTEENISNSVEAILFLIIAYFIIILLSLALGFKFHRPRANRPL